jgi:hypothetical protein
VKAYALKQVLRAIKDEILRDVKAGGPAVSLASGGITGRLSAIGKTCIGLSSSNRKIVSRQLLIDISHYLLNFDNRPKLKVMTCY